MKPIDLLQAKKNKLKKKDIWLTLAVSVINRTIRSEIDKIKQAPYSERIKELGDCYHTDMDKLIKMYSEKGIRLSYYPPHQILTISESSGNNNNR